MNISWLRLMASCFAVFAWVASAECEPANDYKLSGPFAHDNLTVYLVHGKSGAGPVPLTLQEALAKQKVRVVETGNVNELTVENLADEDVFIQSGDIVKGGRQDRALTASLILPPHSGQIAIAAFCVEQGRWSARNAEDGKTFSVADAAMPSREAKVVMSAPPQAAPSLRSDGSAQQAMWAEARHIQDKLSNNLRVDVAEAKSPTSLGLTLDNEKLQRAEGAYVTALQPAAEREDDVVGYVFAINGHINSAAVYVSNGLFRKMWPKLLRASAVEAIGAGSEDVPPLAVEDISNFLQSAETGTTSQRQLTAAVTQETRDGPRSLYVETKRSEGSWVTRSYLAK